MVKKESESVAALVLGIISLVFWLLPILGFPIAVVGLVLSVIGIKNNRKFAMAALVCSVIGLVFATANAAIGAYMGIMGQHQLVNQMIS